MHDLVYRRVRVGLAALAVGAAAVSLLACGSVEPVPGSSATPTSDPPVAATPNNPLDELTDPDAARFDADATPLVVESGTGTGEFAFAVPADTASVTYMVSCAPASSYEVRVSENFFSGSCDENSLNRGSVPLMGEEMAAAEATASVHLPDDVAFWIVGVRDDPRPSSTG